MMIEKTCSCGTKYMVKEYDLKRGWGKSCSKSCAARKRPHIINFKSTRDDITYDDHPFSEEALQG